jgi:hypothetical protein
LKEHAMKKGALAVALVSLTVPAALRAGQAEDEAAIRKFGTDLAAAWNRAAPGARPDPEGRGLAERFRPALRVLACSACGEVTTVPPSRRPARS